MMIKNNVVLGAVICMTMAASSCAMADTPETPSIDVFLQPSNGIVQHVKMQSRQLNKMGESTFYEKGFPPHVTLYLTSYLASALPEVKRVVKDIAKHQYSFPLEITGASVTKSQWVFLDVKDSKTLQTLSDRVAQRLASLHDKSMPTPSWVKKYPEKEAFVKKYGSPNVFSQFQPHITLLANGNEAAVTKYRAYYDALPQKEQSAYGHGIAICIGYADKYGEITKVVARYPLLLKNALRSKK